MKIYVKIKKCAKLRAIYATCAPLEHRINRWGMQQIHNARRRVFDSCALPHCMRNASSIQIMLKRIVENTYGTVLICMHCPDALNLRFICTHYELLQMCDALYAIYLGNAYALYVYCDFNFFSVQKNQEVRRRSCRIFLFTYSFGLRIWVFYIAHAMTDFW